MNESAFLAGVARQLRGFALMVEVQGMVARNELSVCQDEEPFYDEADFQAKAEQFLRLAEQVEAIE